jgi:hypothetical protein
MARLLEVDEATWNQREALFQAASRMYADPKAKLLLEQAQKIVNPAAPTPAIDAHTAQNQPLEEIRAEMAAMKKAREDEAAARKIEESAAATRRMQDEGFAHLRSQHYTSDGIAAVEKLMTEKGILDPRDAAVLFERYNPPQSVATPGGTGGFNFLGGVKDDEVDLKKLIETRGENVPLLDKMINETLNEMRGGQRR